ncbi:putative ribosome biogenesis protein BMS1/TSR1 [Medicago truncatula]|uniref:Putative ribosome biogenesis protein BMS1/TSR1 n=1 Tax=Medicago truncatula TaxID=3880 RepID=A0A396GV71_MEDTR|nr:putative ribosome biogenesis protein BMS1/TSR1 [Medicago truncatula]
MFQVIRSLVPDCQNHEDIVDKHAGEQARPNEADGAKADEDHTQKKTRKRKLPPGTSEYQAAWDEFDEEESDCGIEDDDEDSEEESDNVSMMEVDDMTEEKIQDELKAIKEAHAADEEFPDEVDTPLDVPARTRFAKYKGLKSIRNSIWDPMESLPQDYPKNYNYHSFKRTQKQVLAKALEMERENSQDCIPVGSYIRLHIMEVPTGVASKLCILSKTTPVTACGLLEHENEVSVLHFRPIFSCEFKNADKNKMERFLHAGRFSIASVYAPISFSPFPTIILKRAVEDATPEVAALGSLKTVDRDRIILKRLILTGYPQRVSKRKASVKHMFYNPEDVKFFKPLEIYTKRSLRGRIKEPVGTHGAMKCLLNGVLEQRDTVCMNLYKRAYPKRPNHLFPLSSASDSLPCMEDQNAV